MAKGDNSMIPQHHRMAMGQSVNGMNRGPGGKFAAGGSVKAGLPTSPITDSKRANGVPGMKKGGRGKGC